jgi:collagen type III alpha
VKHLVQGAFQEDWVKQNQQKGGMAAAAGQSAYIPPVPTRAAIGHTIGAQQYLRPHHTGEEWKMSKFKRVAPKVRVCEG